MTDINLAELRAADRLDPARDGPPYYMRSKLTVVQVAALLDRIEANERAIALGDARVRELEAGIAATVAHRAQGGGA